MVVVPSGAMRTRAFITLAACCPAASSTVSPMKNARPAPLVLRKSLRSMSHLLRGLLDGRDDAVVGTAAAEIAIHVLDDLLAARVLVGGEKLGGFHDLARLAVPALRYGLLDPGLLQRMR